MMNSRFASLSRLLIVVAAAGLTTVGCNKDDGGKIRKKPRPVEVALLTQEGPKREQRLVKANVSAWRTETVSMEVGGRLTYLAEENTSFSPTLMKANEIDELIEQAKKEAKSQQDEKTKPADADSQDEGVQDEGVQDEDVQDEGVQDEDVQDEDVQDKIDEQAKRMQVKEDAVNYLPSLAMEKNPPRPRLLIARIDKEKYKIQRDRAQIKIGNTKASIKEAQVELEKLIPAQKRAAKAEQKLAKEDFDRAEKLLAREAGSKAEMLRYEAKLESANANMEQISATEIAKLASIEALRAQLKEDQKALEDAERDLRNCELRFDSFRGELTNLEVEMGDLIQPNEPIGQVLMMDPIQIEFEVSSADSRRLSRMEKLDVYIDGRSEPEKGRIYEIDSVADPTSRTFTVTILLINGKFDPTQGKQDGESKNEMPAKQLPTTDTLIPMDISFLGDVTRGKSYAAESWIFKDAKGVPYVLTVDNWKKGDPVPEEDLRVTRVDVEVGEDRVLFYGEMFFREVKPLLAKPDEERKFDPDINVVGEVTLPDGVDPATWDWSKNNLIDFQEGSQWILRPGDLVDVDIAKSSTESNEYRIPIDAISHESGKFYIFLLSTSAKENKETTVEKVEIDILDKFSKQNADDISSFLRIRPAQANEKMKDLSFEGREYVRRGAHYLMDGEPVKVISSGDE